MTENEALARMVAPGQVRPNKPYFGGVIQILVTSQCDKACLNCTQASQLRRPKAFMTVELFEHAVRSLRGYFGVVGVFGGNPALHPEFKTLCRILSEAVPFERRGLWCNNPLTLDNARVMRKTFNPAVSNLNVHLDARAYQLFKEGWPESRPFGLHEDSRHSPPYVAMQDVVPDEATRWELISACDVNQHWSALIGVFRGQLRAWFCEIAGAQAILHQDEPDYPDTGFPLQWSEKDKQDYHDLYVKVHGGPPPENPPIPKIPWWKLPMGCFMEQVRKHCHECSVPLRGHGELAQAADGVEQVSATHAAVYQPKRPGRKVEVVTELVQLGSRLGKFTDYLGNARRS